MGLAAHCKCANFCQSHFYTSACFEGRGGRFTFLRRRETRRHSLGLRPLFLTGSPLRGGSQPAGIVCWAEGPGARSKASGADGNVVPVEKAASSNISTFEDDMSMAPGLQAALYVAAATAFGLGIWVVQGGEKASEFFAGYLLEQSLSIDNLFVFVLVFKYFRTPVDAQRTCLFWGILTAAVLRLVMIGLGVELIEHFEPLLLLFAAILVFSAYKLLVSGDDDDDEDLSNNTVVKFCRRFIAVTDHYDGERFVTMAEDGVRVLTPLVLVLAVIEISDVIFAVDSIPAVFGVTLDPFIVYTSNIFAIVSLRGFYSFVAVFMAQLRFLDKAVALVLGFIGVKMVFDFFGYKLPTPAALLVVGVLLGTGVVASYMFPKHEEDGSDGGDHEAPMGSEEHEEHSPFLSNGGYVPPQRSPCRKRKDSGEEARLEVQEEDRTGDGGSKGDMEMADYSHPSTPNLTPRKLSHAQAASDASSSSSSSSQ